MNIQKQIAKYLEEYKTASPERQKEIKISGEFLVNPGWQRIYMGRVIWEGGSTGHYVDDYTPKPEQPKLAEELDTEDVLEIFK